MSKTALAIGTTVIGTFAGVVALASPALATVTVTDGPGGFLVTGDGAADSGVVRCFAGTAQVNNTNHGSCSGVTGFGVDPGPGADTIDLSLVAHDAFPAITLIEVTTGMDDDADTVDGSQLDDEIFTGPEDTVYGNAGDDTIEDAQLADGGPGNDTLAYTSATANGGDGNDTIYNPLAGTADGGVGDDTVQIYRTEGSDHTMTLGATHLTTDPIADQTKSPTRAAGIPIQVALTGIERYDVKTGAGNDRIDVRNGLVDKVDCGAGNDIVTADYFDSTANCEEVDSSAPSTGRIHGPRKVRKGHPAEYTFTSDAPGATYECQLDKSAPRPCTATFVLKTRRLKPGKHLLEVAAVVSGYADATPATKTIRIVKKGHHR